MVVACGGYLFPGRWSGHVEASYVGKHITRLLPDGWSAHSLRHRYATRTYESTHDLYLVSKLLGHSSVETTQIYVAMPDSRLRAGMSVDGFAKQFTHWPTQINGTELNGTEEKAKAAAACLA